MVNPGDTVFLRIQKMSSMRSSLRVCIFLIILTAVISSCKERNDVYPPVPWSIYFYEKPDIAPRPYSCILVENEHSEWLGGQGCEGLLFSDGHEWNVINVDNSGIAFDSVTAMLRDGNGILWVAWKSGLACYNGTAWTEMTEFRGRKVTSLALQGIGIIWAGIDGDRNSGGIARFTQDRWEFFTPGSSAIASSRITALAIDQDQKLWMGTADKGFLILKGTEFAGLSFESLGIRPSRINCTCQSPGGTIWAGTASSHIIRMNGDDVNILNTGTGAPVTGLLVSHDGSLWIGTKGAGLLKMLNGKWTSYTKTNSHLPDDTILSLAANPDGTILAGFTDGHILSFKNE